MCTITFRNNEGKGRGTKRLRNDFGHKVRKVRLIDAWGNEDLDQFKWQQGADIWKEKQEQIGDFLHS